MDIHAITPSTLSVNSKPWLFCVSLKSNKIRIHNFRSTLTRGYQQVYRQRVKVYKNAFVEASFPQPLRSDAKSAAFFFYKTVVFLYKLPAYYICCIHISFSYLVTIAKGILLNQAP